MLQLPATIALTADYCASDFPDVLMQFMCVSADRYELAQLGESAETDVDDVRNKYGVDRKGHVGNRVVSSSMTIKLTRSDQRKALLRARIDRHGEGPRKSRTLPPRSEQKQLFQMYNSFKQDRIEYVRLSCSL